MICCARILESGPSRRADTAGNVLLLICSPNYTGLRTLEIGDVILFSGDGVAPLLNRPKAIITTQGGSRAHILKCDAAIQDSPAPTRNPDHMLASIRARAR